MAFVLPFTGVRPPAQLAAQVAAPPYDVISSDEARELARDNPYCFLHISKPEIDFGSDVDPHSDRVYQQGRDNLVRFLNEGILHKDDSASFYVYRQTLDSVSGQHSQTGIVGLVSVDDYESGVIRKHELTRPEKEDDRARHMQVLAAQTGPVFLTYKAEETLAELMSQGSQGAPVYDFLSDGVQHQVWTLTDSALIEKISAGFNKIDTLYVADGHHRSAAAARYRAIRRADNSHHQGTEAYNYFIGVMFPHDQLHVLGYHRVVRDLGQYNPATFLTALENDFTVRRSDSQVIPEQAGQFGLYLAQQWYLLSCKTQQDQSSDPVARLDVSIHQSSVLSPLLGIDDPRKDSRIDFIGGIRGAQALEKAVDSGEFSAAFACFPVTVSALMDVAGAGKMMPPKSTWFEPKLKSGLIIHTLD